jgi:ubiquinone/menaquinone biosynthesis C-methylase UbiE
MEGMMARNGSAGGQVDEDKAIKDQMEKAAPSYDSYMKKVTLGRERTLREITINLADVKPGDCVLEVGCGTGTLTLAAKRRAGPSGKAFGIDIIPAMIGLSQRKAAQAGEDATFQLGSIDNVPFPPSQFDVVMCSFMIFHMSEAVRRKGIAEIHRVLKPQGRLLVVDLALPATPVARITARILLGFMLKHDLQELFSLMEAAGFSDVETAPVKFRILGLPILSYVRGRARKS